MPAVHDDRAGRLDRIETEIAAKSRLWMQAMWAGHGDEVEFIVREVDELRTIRALIEREAT